MRKNRTAKFIFNGALLAVMAVLGVTAYQVANKPEHISGSASIGKHQGK